jgi:putative spermidine/putrescine transport system substrate-binding protein
MRIGRLCIGSADRQSVTRPAVAAFMFAAGVLGLAGCGGSSTAPTSSAGATTASKGTNQLVINSFGGDWGNAIQQGMINAFEAQTGIKVTLLSTADPAKSELAVEHGDPPPEDILDTDYPTATGLNNKGLLAPIDYASFDQANLAKIPSYLKAPYALGWGEFAIGICYNPKDFPGAKPTTWADFWNFTKFPGNRGMLSWPAEPQPEFGLLALGDQPSSLYPLNVHEAFAQLAKLKPHVPSFPSDPATLQQQLVDGTVSMEACYTHRVQKLIDQGAKNIAISYDQARLESDYFIVWKNAPNRVNAMKFLDFMLHPKPQAAWAVIGDTAPINPGAFAYIPPSVREKLATAPDHLRNEFVIGDKWYATTASNGQTNFQNIINEWNNAIGG